MASVRIFALSLLLLGFAAAQESNGDDAMEPMDDADVSGEDVLAEMKDQCAEKLQIWSEIMDETGSWEETAARINAANAAGYPENSLGYLWCAEFPMGVAKAKEDVA